MLGSKTCITWIGGEDATITFAAKSDVPIKEPLMRIFDLLKDKAASWWKWPICKKVSVAVTSVTNVLRPFLTR